MYLLSKFDGHLKDDCSFQERIRGNDEAREDFK